MGEEEAMLRSLRMVLGIGVGLLFLNIAKAGDWPRFLGPGHDAKAHAEDAAGFWKGGELRKLWEYPKGSGWACPAVVGGRVLVFHRLESREVLACLDAESGDERWRFEYEAPYRDRYGSGEGPRTSPVVEGGRVVVFGVSGLVHCVELESGGLIWKRDVAGEYAMRENFFGHGGTPLILQGRVIVPVGGAGGRCVVAFSLEDGAELWVANHEWGAGYASPIPFRFPDSQKMGVLVFAGGESRPPTGGLLSLDASSGRVMGELEHRASIAESVNAASPVMFGGRVFTSEAYGSGGMLSEIRPDGSLREVRRGLKLGAHFMTPLARDGMILGFDGQNPRLCELVCLDGGDGSALWRDDLGGRFGRGSLVDLGEAGVLALGEFGELALLECRKTGVRVVKRARLFGAPETWTIPVLAGRRLYVCQNQPGRGESVPRVICYGE